MKTSTRRIFMMQVIATGAATLASNPATAAAKKLEEADPKAVSLGYKHDSAQVDQKRFPKHTAAEKCANCMAFLGKPSDAWAECDLLTDRMVSVTGWCSSYVKAG
jgi:High potential iron-sulfur protein